MNRDDLVAAYTAPGRHYHNLAHIEDCLGALARVDNLSALEREILSEAMSSTTRPALTMKSSARAWPNSTCARIFVRKSAASSV